MRKFIKPQRNQLLMLQTIDLNSIALPGSALYSIDTIVDSLDTGTFEAVYDLESSRGNCPIAPKTIIKVCLYALHSGRFSTRKMEYDTGHHLGYMFLTGAQRIDHSTFSKFLSKFKNEVVALFSQIVLVCVEQGLVDFKVLCIDSVKLRANASHKQQKNRNGLEKATAEAPYGCIKRNWKFTHVLRRGITKVAMEAALLFSLHNILKLGTGLNPI
jgi:transposase